MCDQAWLRWYAANVQVCRNPVAGCAPRARSRAYHLVGAPCRRLAFPEGDAGVDSQGRRSGQHASMASHVGSACSLPAPFSGPQTERESRAGWQSEKSRKCRDDTARQSLASASCAPSQGPQSRRCALPGPSHTASLFGAWARVQRLLYLATRTPGRYIL